MLGEGKENVRITINYITSDLIGLEREHEETQDINPEYFAQLIKMITEAELSSRGGKDTLRILFTDGGEPQQIADDKGLLQQSSEDDLLPIVQEIISQHDDVAKDYREGNESAIQFLVGQGMAKTGGSANPQILKQLLEKELSG
jgi:aspartyl-tRNA(Asn)/glutamyl-tRNA(Gln) amidotransferase subunit B